MCRWAGHRGIASVVVAVPSDELETMGMEILNGGGKVRLFAHTRRGEGSRLDLSSGCVGEMELLGNHSADVTLQKAVASLVCGRKLDVNMLITDVFSLEDAVAAVRLAAKPKLESLKVLVCPGGVESKRPKMFKNRLKKS